MFPITSSLLRRTARNQEIRKQNSPSYAVVSVIGQIYRVFRKSFAVLLIWCRQSARWIRVIPMSQVIQNGWRIADCQPWGVTSSKMTMPRAQSRLCPGIVVFHDVILKLKAQLDYPLTFNQSNDSILYMRYITIDIIRPSYYSISMLSSDDTTMYQSATYHSICMMSTEDSTM